MKNGSQTLGKVIRGSLMVGFLLSFVACWTPDMSEGDYAVDWGEATLTINGDIVPYDADIAGYVGEIPIGNDTITLVFDAADPDALRPTPCGEWVDTQVRICSCTADEATGELKGLCESLVVDPDLWNITAPDKNAFGTAGKAALVAGEYTKVTPTTSDVIKEAGYQLSKLSFDDVGLGINGQGGLWGVSAAAQQRLVYLEGEPGTQNWGTSEDPAHVSSYEGHIGISIGFLRWWTGVNLHYSRPFTLVKI